MGVRVVVRRKDFASLNGLCRQRSSTLGVIQRGLEHLGIPTVDEIGMDTITGSITVGPCEVTIGGDSWCPSRGTPGKFEHDLGNSDWMSPRTLSLTIVGASRIGHVRLVGLVEILTVPTGREDGLDSDTVRTWDVEVEVVLVNASGEEIGIDVTSEGRDTI